MENRKENYIKGVQPIVEEVQKYMSKHNPQFSDITFVNSDNQTLQFVDLVQEGGGTLGIALVGYVYVLEKAGIRFVSMAGTSAGSINTILLASMGKPEEMKSDKVLDVLANKELSDFIDCGIWSFDIEKIALWLFTRKFWGFKRIGEVLTIPIVVIKNLSFGGLCAGRHFEEWLKDILDRNNIYTFGQLKERMNDFPPEIRNRVTADIAIIAADTTTSTKAVFPKMNDLYYDNGNEISPSESVRMSMSIPFILLCR